LLEEILSLDFLSLSAPQALLILVIAFFAYSFCFDYKLFLRKTKYEL